jgi:hypothetical protein
MVVRLVEYLWVGSGASLTLLLGIALFWWIGQEARERARERESETRPPTATADGDNDQGPSVA